MSAERTILVVFDVFTGKYKYQVAFRHLSYISSYSAYKSAKCEQLPSLFFFFDETLVQIEQIEFLKLSVSFVNLVKFKP